MKTEKNILVAFLLNIIFSIFEFISGMITNSVAIMSDSIHDMGDAMSIGISYFLEKKSKKKADDVYTYGYIRYSILGSVVTTVILLLGSGVVIYNSILRIIHPVKINYNGMIIFAIVGVLVNFLAAYYTKDGDSLNQKSVNLHMLEDVLGWVVILIGAILMKFTDISVIDAILSIAVSLFILVNALRNLKDVIDIFLDKIPNDVDIKILKTHLLEIDGVFDIHHIHISSIDGYNVVATMHVVIDKNKEPKLIKQMIKKELKEHNICHVTVEIEEKDENCNEKKCVIEKEKNVSTHNHVHHH